MIDLLLTLYPWVKALHIVAVISWMAALFYLPRLFVHHVERAPIGSDTSETFKMMEMKLHRVIMNPAMMVTWVAGLTLAIMPGVASGGWFIVKFLAVIAMTVFHVWLGKQRKAFLADANTHSGKTYRIANEIPTVLMLIIVIMVVVKPF